LEHGPAVRVVHLQEFTPWLMERNVQLIKRRGIAVLATVHNVVPHRYPAAIPKQLHDRWRRRGWRACDGLFVHTARLRGELSAFLGANHPPIHVTPHGVWSLPPGTVLPSAAERLRWKKLLFFGNIRRNKGLHLLLDALDNTLGFSLTIAGAADDRAYFDDDVAPRIVRAKDRGVKIDLQEGFAADDELHRLFLSHSAIVLPYTADFVAQSGVMFMGLAYRLPILASASGAMAEFIADHRAGFVFDPTSRASLSAALTSLADATAFPALVANLEAAATVNSWSATASPTLAAYRQVA
jgi:glycosyltransferase involved in cell wall biosynthesis